MELFRDLSESEANEFRQWARDNYKLGESIKSIWHPVIQDECNKMQTEVLPCHLFKIGVSNMVSSSGNHVPNQFEIFGRDNNGKSFRIFQSYSTTIAKIYEEYPNDRVFLDINHWQYSTTTGKYRNIFLNEKKQDTLKKIKSGEYTLTNLN
jgi:hypothetical protein